MTRKENEETSNLPLCVDMDGTLLRTDLLAESAIALALQKPWLLLLYPLWFLGGRARFKLEIATRIDMLADLFPYHHEFLDYLQGEHEKGRPLYLVTGSATSLADAVGKSVGIFEEVMASDETVNLTGTRKSRLLMSRFGRKGFVYAGNSRKDLEVWNDAAGAVVVDAPKAVYRSLQELGIPVLHSFQPKRRRLFFLMRQLRPHHWSKNLLIFIPLIGAHQILNPSALLSGVAALFSFSLCASAAYSLNDLADLEHDRSHPDKRLRPMAGGDLPLVIGLSLVPFLLAAAFTIAFLLSRSFAGILAIYLLLALLYSWKLKRTAVLDVLLLASLYVVRIIAGGEAADIEISQWLLALSLFFFLSLAFLKRFAETAAEKTRGGSASPGRPYQVQDLNFLLGFGASSGLLSIVVFALYINSSAVAELYSRPEILWLACLPLVYWISRAWLQAGRGQMREDPLVFALTDPPTYAAAASIAILLVAAV